MKKCLAMLMILCILVSFSGCGSPGAQSAGPVDGERPGEAGQAGEEKPSFPEKAITLIIPVAAGSGADIHGRKLASIAEKYLGQPIIVENIAGGNQAVGTVAMLNREADGYTVCQTSPSLYLWRKTLLLNGRIFSPLRPLTPNPTALPSGEIVVLRQCGM